MRVKLEDVCERGTSSLMQKDIVDKNGKYPVYGASGRIGSMETYQQEHQTVAVVKDGAGIGRTMLLPEKSSVIGTMQYLIPKNCIESEYLYYVVKYMHLEKYFSGATIPHIYFRDYKTEEFNLHDKTEQREIVSTLKRIEAIISNRQEQLTKLDELVKARFVEMFGGYAPNAKLSDVASITGGLTKNSNRNIMKLKLPYLRVANVSYAKIDVSEMLEIGLTEDERAKTLLSYDDLLFVEGNGSPDQIGRVALWKNEITPCVHQNHLIKARFNSHLIVPYFALHYFMSREGREQIQGKAVSTSGLYTLSVSKISNLLIPTPPLSLQNQFADFVAEVDKSKVEVQKALDQTQLLFDSLMQQYFG